MGYYSCVFYVGTHIVVEHKSVTQDSCGETHTAVPIYGFFNIGYYSELSNILFNFSLILIIRISILFIL